MERLKTKSNRTSIFENRKPIGNYHKSPGATSSVTKSNEKDRLVRCRHCGFICDKERDVRLPDGSFAGFGINNGSERVSQSYIKYYGTTATTKKSVLKNGGFTEWMYGWNPVDPNGPTHWTMEATDGSDTRCETEDATYLYMAITVGGPD